MTTSRVLDARLADSGLPELTGHSSDDESLIWHTFRDLLSVTYDALVEDDPSITGDIVAQIVAENMGLRWKPTGHRAGCHRLLGRATPQDVVAAWMVLHMEMNLNRHIVFCAESGSGSGVYGGGGNRTRVRATPPRFGYLSGLRVCSSGLITAKWPCMQTTRLSGRPSPYHDVDTLDTPRNRLATPFAGSVDTGLDTSWTPSAARSHGSAGWTA